VEFGVPEFTPKFHYAKRRFPIPEFTPKFHYAKRRFSITSK
jgi:hypothetical protein